MRALAISLCVLFWTCMAVGVTRCHAATLTATPATLVAVAKAAAPGDDIQFTGAFVGPLTGINQPAPGITITATPGSSFEPNPVSKWMSIGVNGVTFRGFKVNTTGALMGVGPCDRVFFEDTDFGGLGDTGGGVQFRNCTNVGVKNSRFHDGVGGIGGLQVRGITIAGNDFRNLLGDAVQLVTYGDVLIEGNTISGFRGTSLHLDVFQMIAADNLKPVDRITIRNNVYTRGVGGVPAQFIFMGDSAAGHTNLSFTGNAAWGAGWHCITFKYATDALVADNYCQGSTEKYPRDATGQVLIPGINPIEARANVVVRDNFSPAPAADDSGLQAWLHRNDPPADPKDAEIARLKALLTAANDNLAAANDNAALALKARDDARAVAESRRIAAEASEARAVALSARLTSIAAIAAP